MALLELRDIAKHFGAIEALKGVDLDLEPGEVLGLMGDNGAGKSTLVKIIAGNFPPSAGRMELEGEHCAFHQAAGCPRPRHRDRLSGSGPLRQPDGGRQRLSRPRAEAGLRPVPHPATTAAMFERAAELFAELKSETRPRDLVRQMSGGQRQAVAIARTRLSDPKIVLMDEPTAAISVRQVAEVLDLIRRLRDQGDRRHPDQPPHARRLRRLRPRRRAAPRRARSPTSRSSTPRPKKSPA